MNKSKNNILEKTALFALTLTMLTGVIAFPASVSAATKPKTTIPKKFADKEACLAKLKTYKYASLKTYGNKRIDQRLRFVKDQPAKTEKAYKKYEKAEPVVKKKIKDATTARVAATGQANAPVLPASGKADLLKEVKSTQVELEKRQEALNKTNNPAVASEAICSTMFDLRVFSYLDTKIKAQLKIDTARLSVHLNEERLLAVKETYAKHKKDKAFAKKTAKYKEQIEGLTDYKKEINELNVLQSRLDSINVERLNTDNQATKEEIKNIVGATNTIIGSTKTATISMNTLYKAVTKAAPKK